MKNNEIMIVINDRNNNPSKVTVSMDTVGYNNCLFKTDFTS